MVKSTEDHQIATPFGLAIMDCGIIASTLTTSEASATQYTVQDNTAQGEYNE